MLACLLDGSIATSLCLFFSRFSLSNFKHDNFCDIDISENWLFFFHSYPETLSDRSIDSIQLFFLDDNHDDDDDDASHAEFCHSVKLIF
ncbi:hypothetical protein T06_11633 [Trichinella sp. T6]|nr:hypothetical protein T06_11633 [Trichinella sp. T6]